MVFRALRADEIDVRVSTVSGNGCSLLLYKDARCDMNILDETVGTTNWQRRHTRDNANCIVSIWDEKKSQWIEKEDTGTESYTEKEKGQASDSFKRACFNWGIGRELYTAPFIWIPAGKVNLTPKNGKYTTNDRFKVTHIKIENKKIVELEIENEKTHAICYVYANCLKAQQQYQQPQQNQQPKKRQLTPREMLIIKLKQKGIDAKAFANEHQISQSTTDEEYARLLALVGD